MKLKALTFGAVLALLGASVAVAAPPTGKGKPPTTGAGCKPNIAVILTGRLAADAGTSPTSLSVNVSGGNHFAAAFKHQSILVALASSTKVNRQGDRNAADLKSGDKVNIQAKACKASIGTSLTATRVTAHPAKA